MEFIDGRRRELDGLGRRRGEGTSAALDGAHRRRGNGSGGTLSALDGYAELSSQTYYSFLRAGSSPEDLANEAARLGLSALALTDLNGVYGMPKVWGAFREIPDAPKLLVGAGLPVGNFSAPGTDTDTGAGAPLTVNLIAKNRAAYGALCRIFTEAHRDQPKGSSLLAVDAFLSLMRETPGAGDLFVLPQWEDAWELGHSLKPDWLSVFPRDRLFIPLSRTIDGRDRERTEYSAELARFFDRERVAHNRVLYHRPDRRRVQDTVTCIREGVTFKTAGYRIKRNEEAYLKSPRVMRSLFHDHPDLITRGLEIADECTFLPSELRYRYPSEWLPAGESAQTYLERLCVEGKRERYGNHIPEKVEAQLRYELKLISELGYADYFLTVYDIVDFAKKKDILCQGRGSAANSIVCYVLGVTAIDPVQMNLLFERFISAERGEPPDIDVDFEHERREEVLQYVYEKYGRDRAAMVSAVVTYRKRSALRETAKAFGVEVGTLSARAVEKILLDPEKTKTEFSMRVDQISSELEGFPRHLSIHSGGFTLSADPITEIVPVEPASMEGRTIIQWDKYDLDILGLLKVDLLSLGMLTALQKGLKMVGRKLYEIPHDDPGTYAMIQRADTIGTFQIESRAQMAMLPRLLPRCFYDLVIEVALVRPGPIVGKMVHPYLKRRRGEEEWTLPHPALGPILGRTFGVPIFQEQVMKMAIAIGGFTPGEADKLRKAIGAWRSSGSIDVMGKKLQAGLLKAGIPEEFSQRIFDQIQGFAEYGFPESHAASFALLAYASCWLKHHHPAEFLVAMLNSQPMGFYAPHTLVDDAKRHGVRVLPISIHASDWETKLELSAEGKRSVRLGMHHVRGMNEKEWLPIARARAENPFTGFQDFITRSFGDADGARVIRKNVLRTMAVADVFKAFGVNQREALWKVLSVEAMAWTPLFTSEVVQGELFKEAPIEAMDGYETVLSDYAAIGLSHRGHPMEWVRKRMQGHGPAELLRMDSRRAKEFAYGKKIAIPGLSLVLQRPPTAGGTAFGTLEDEFGFLDLIMHREVFERIREVMLDEPFVVVTGTIQRDGLAVSLIVADVKPFMEPGAEGDSPLAQYGIEGAGTVRFPDTPGSIARRY